MQPGKQLFVLFLVPTLNGGGAERVMLTLLRHLDRSRFKLALGVLDAQEIAYPTDVPPDVAIIFLRSGRVRQSLTSIVRLIWQLRPDVVFSVIGHLNLAIAMLKPLLPRRTRLVARETNVLSEILSTGKHGRLWRLAYRWLYPRFDVIVCQSPDMRRDLLSELQVSAGALVVIRNPVDHDHIRRLSHEEMPVGSSWEGDGIHLIAAGRFVAEKGLDILLGAVAMLSDLPIRVTVLGDGPLREDLDLMAAKLGVTGRVRFIGFQPNPYPFIARASALVLSSRVDAFPNVVLEALACGTPVIATPAVGGVRELLERRPGCAVAARITAEALADTIRHFAFVESRAMIEAELDEFSPHAVCCQYAEVFEDVVREVQLA